MLSVHITAKVVSLNPTHGQVYSMQHYVINSNNAYWLRLQFFSYLKQYIIDNFVISGTSLLLVGMLGMVIIFIYALVSFAILRERFLYSSLGRHCTTVYECFITVLHHGFVDSLYTVSVTKYRKFRHIEI
jgi:hypothetical protein